MYFTIFINLPPIFGIILAVIVGLLCLCKMKPDKMVRMIFPYIRRNGNNTVMFGYILQKQQIIELFLQVCIIISQVILTFFANILITYTNNNNLFSATSIELQCSYDNGTIVNLTAIKTLKLDKDILCIAINFNIAGAMGQATGALALGWIITSIASWIILYVNYCIIQHCIKNNERKLKCYQCSLCIILVIIILAIAIILCIIIGHYYNTQPEWYLYLFKPENGTVLVVIGAVLCICMATATTDIEKESNNEVREKEELWPIYGPTEDNDNTSSSNEETNFRPPQAIVEADIHIAETRV